MMDDNGDLVRSRRPFPHDAHASYRACEETYSVEVSTLEELTPDVVRQHVLEAARGYRQITFTIGEELSLHEIDRCFNALKTMLEAVMPFTFMWAWDNVFHTRLYDYSECPMEPEKEALVNAMLARLGLSLDPEPGPACH